jgi:tripartite-type tricarboxylate transporter receptor subunit TctC
LPDVPTFREQGVALAEESTWFGIFVPKGTPAPIIAKLNSDVEQVLAQPAMQARAVQLGLRLIGGSPARLAAWSQNDIAKWAAVGPYAPDWRRID